jgi:FKBP-type peptidyl-prolyl cis-trans isomerase FkpA
MKFYCARRIAVLAVFVLAACERDTPREEALAPPEATAPDAAALPVIDPQLGIVLERMTRTPSGLYVEDRIEGAGEPAGPGDEIRVHYTGWLPDGTQFDTSRRGNAFVFQLGRGMVIPGWEEGVAGMREGGHRLLVIPPELGYGAEGVGGVIPPNATLIFDVELLNIR